MYRLNSNVIRAGLEGAYFSGAHLLAAPFLRGAGLILTMHQVRPAEFDDFHPNGILEITPEFLENVVVRIRRRGFEIVSLDEAHRRLTTPGRHRRFVVLTFDDGYRDNKVHAWPILHRLGAPFTIYVPTAYPDGLGDLWWLALEMIVAAQEVIAVDMDGEHRLIPADDAEEKSAAYAVLYGWLRRMEEKAQRRAIHDLAARYGVDMRALCRELIMTWPEIAEMARDPLVTIGAHTIDHYAVARLPAEEARRQMRDSAAVIEAALGRRPRHFSYPYGSPCAAGPRDFAIARDLGFATAVTTRPGVLFPAHAEHLTALPRVSLNGNFQSLRYLDVFLSGLPFFVLNGLRRVAVA